MSLIIKVVVGQIVLPPKVAQVTTAGHLLMDPLQSEGSINQ